MSSTELLECEHEALVFIKINAKAQDGTSPGQRVINERLQAGTRPELVQKIQECLAEKSKCL